MSREITELLGKAMEAQQLLTQAACRPEKLRVAMIANTDAMAKLILAIERLEAERDRYKSLVGELQDRAERQSLERDSLT